ncbi:MAG: hypothetical protein JO316_14605 [Abitibacteriaceae bacterium]|nr:hypothetical protein [Abditibacteriaceae bacterium]MBV9866582.1 hypothetical protein [Abditibacteriaceae bacterium]
MPHTLHQPQTPNPRLQSDSAAQPKSPGGVTSSQAQLDAIGDSLDSLRHRIDAYITKLETSQAKLRASEGKQYGYRKRSGPS